MAKNRRIKSRKLKSKLSPIPHNNRGNVAGRMARTQIITVLDPNKKGQTILGKPCTIKKTVFHMNLTPYEESRIHLIKVALEANDTEILKKLNPRERKLYDNMLKEKQKREGGYDGVGGSV